MDLLRLEIGEIAADLFDLAPISFGVAVIEEILVAAVHSFHSERVFDWTPILLSAGRDLRHKSENAIGIGAIQAVHFFNEIQISQAVPIEQNEIRSADFWNAVNWKTDHLINGDDQVEKNDRERTEPDDRRGQEDKQI